MGLKDFGFSVILLVFLITLSSVSQAEEPEALEPKAGPDAFQFIIGNWQAEVRLPQPDGSLVRQTATWSAHQAIEGRIILEEYKALSPEGEVVVMGTNIRKYDAKKERWAMYWVDALSGNVIHLGPPDLGGVSISPDGISFKFRFGDVLSRARFDNITKDSFIWHGDASKDNGVTWQMDTIIVEARRVRD